MLFLQIFKTPSLPNRMSWGPEILRECSPLLMSHMSCVPCNMSNVTFLFNFFLQCGGACWWRVCYQRGLPSLVFVTVTHSNRPSVAGAVQQTPSLLIHSLIESVNNPFPPNLQNIITPKPYKKGG